MKTDKVTGGPLSDYLVRSLAKMSADEFEIAVRNGEVPGELKGKPGPRRWDAVQVGPWIQQRRGPHWRL